jgi:hypothetical protein
MRKITAKTMIINISAARFSRSVAAIFLAAVICASCESRSTPALSDAEIEKTVTALVNEMAANASSRDVESNLRLIPKTENVVYVSDGSPITGSEYGKELGASYTSRSQMSFHWDKLEITPIANSAASVTGWATVSITPLNGQSKTERYIFTMTFADDGSGWKRIIAQKSVLNEQP